MSVLRSARRGWLLAAFCLTLICACGVPALLASARPPATAAVDVTFVGHPVPIPRSFFGLSIEYTELGDYEQLGPAFDHVIDLLRPADGSSMLLRLGGRSADEVVWTPTPPAAQGPQTTAYATPSVRGAPHWVRELTPAWLAQLGALVRRDHLHVEPELNLAVHSPRMAVQFTRAVQAALPSNAVEGVAIGNEPDLYRKQPSLDKERIPSTLASTSHHWTFGYSAARYRVDYVAYARALRRSFPQIGITAPDMTYPSEAWAGDLLSLGRLRPDSISIHRYATATCTNDFTRVPSPLSFLDDRYTHGLAKTLRGDLNLVEAHHLDLRVTEMNSFTCGGRKRIAESFATALWAPDAIFEMLHIGVAGISWHIHPDMPNSPFHLTRNGIVALPELYGLAVFTQMLGPDPELDPVHVSDTRQRSLKVWAVSTSHGLKVLALDKGSMPVLVRVSDPLGVGTARLGRLTAPTLASETGVTFAGQRIGADGTWVGPRIEAPIAHQSGVYAFRLAPYTGAVLTVDR